MRRSHGIRTLTLAEYHTTPAVPLTLRQRDTLQCCIPSITITPTAGTRDSYDLTPGSWVGTVSIGGLAVEIRPKLPISNLLFLIAYALDPTAWQEVPFDYIASALTEAVVPAFVHLVRRATGRGLLHGYRTEDAALQTMRGQVRFAAHARRLGVAPPIEVRVDDYTADVDENRLLKAALYRLRSLPLRTPAAAHSLLGALCQFDEVRSVQYEPRRLPQPPRSRLNAHYQPALRLARLILQATAFDLGHGDAPATSFLVDMNQVFEDFVVIALREALGLDERTFPQGLRRGAALGRQRHLPLDHAGTLGLEPDLSWWEGERCCFVGDVKYKRTGAAGGEHPDLYQLLAYAVAAGLPGGLLIYAAGEDIPIAHQVRRATKTLHVTALDLSGPPPDILRQIGQVAEQVRALRVDR